MKIESKRRTEKRRWRFVGWLVGGLATLVYILAAAGKSAAAWTDETYGVGFDQLLYVLASPLKGTGQDVTDKCLAVCLPAVQEAVVPYLVGFGAVLLLRHFWRFAIAGEKNSFEPLALTEWVMLGLRTVAGLGPKEYERRFRRRFSCFLPFLNQCAQAGYAVEEEGRWHLTPKGFLLSNQIIAQMLDILASEKRRRAEATARGDFRVELD